MLRSDKYNLLWSTWYDEEICENIYDDNCTNECGYEGGCCYKNNSNCLCSYEYDYDFMNDIIREDLQMKFGENNYQYFLVGDSCFWYGGYEGNKPNMNVRVSILCDGIEELLDKVLSYCDDYRIYKGKYNSLWIEGSHHDGSEVYQVCRLSKYGQEMYDKDYQFNWRNHCVKSVLKDFDFFN